MSDMIEANEQGKATEKEKKVEMHEAIEELEEVDKSTGPEFVKSMEDEKRKEAIKQKEMEMNQLGMTHTDEAYKLALTRLANSKIPKLDLPKGWKAQFIATRKGAMHLGGKSFKTEDGLVVIMESPRKADKPFVRAMSVTYNPNYDHKGVATLLQQMENTVDSYGGKLLSDRPNDDYNKTESGIYVPK